MIKIHKSHPNFDEFYWLTEAISKDLTTRIALTYMKVETKDDGLKFIATDGHRLHMFIQDSEEIKYFEPGLYEVVTRKRTEIVFHKSDEITPYPDYEKVIPQKSEGDAITVMGHPKPYVSTSGFCKLIRAMDKSVNLDFELYKKIASLHQEYTFYVNNKKPFSGVYFESKNVSGVLMPLRNVED